MGDFISGGDGRLSKTVVHADFGTKINSSMSFDIRSMACLCCPLKHSMSEGKRMAFILADQAFPAALPSETEKSCPFILRIENGSIADLVSHFLDITNSCKIPHGSVIVASSATQMARCGTAAYASALANNGGRISRAFNNQVEWMPGPPILGAGTCDAELLRSIYEIGSWVRFSLLEPASTLSEAFKALTTTISNNAGGKKLPEERRFMLPCNLMHQPIMKTWASIDNCLAIPTQVWAFSEEMEAPVIISMVEELNLKMGLDLEPRPNFCRTADQEARITQAYRGAFLMVGASNAERTAAAIRLEGHPVNTITTTNWKPNCEAVDALADHVRDAVRSGHTSATVFQILENLLYMGRLLDGTTSHAKKDASGKYHVIGELIVADKAAQFNLYKALRPALIAAGAGPIIIIPPLPRFTQHGCCQDPTNLSNRGGADFLTDINMTSEPTSGASPFLTTCAGSA